MIKSWLCLSVILFASAALSRADDKIAVFSAGSEVYSNVTVTSVSATDVYFMYAGGMANVKLKDLTPDWQKHFHFDPAKAKTAEAQQAENKLRYHDQILHAPAAHGPDETRVNTPAAGPANASWVTDLPAALAQAQAEHKLVLLDFTGSDWCPWCIKFDEEVLSTDQFLSYASTRLVLVRLDYPHNVPQDDGLKRANAALLQQFRVDGFPTYVLLAPNGQELGRQTGYRPGGPVAFMQELLSFVKH